MKGGLISLLVMFLFWFGGAVFASEVLVAVSIEPQRFIVERIGGDALKVMVIVPAGKNPHNYEPTPQQMRDIANSLVWFTLGIEFEKVLIPKVKSVHKDIIIVDISEGIKRRIMREDEIVEDKYGEHHRGDEVGGEDPHIWMSPRLVKQQAKIVYETLAKLDRLNEDFYKRNYEKLLKELDSLDTEISNKLKPYKGRKFLVYHPVLGYFADDYGLKQLAIEIRGREPSPSQLNKIIMIAKKNGIRTVFVQEGFSKKSAEAVARAINGKVVEINPLSYDYIKMIRSIADVIVEGWK